MNDALVQPAHAQPKHLFGIVSKVDFAATAVAAGGHSHFGWIKRFRVSSYACRAYESTLCVHNPLRTLNVPNNDAS